MKMMQWFIQHQGDVPSEIEFTLPEAAVAEFRIL
jgi:hypothetical protein